MTAPEPVVLTDGEQEVVPEARGCTRIECWFSTCPRFSCGWRGER